MTTRTHVVSSTLVAVTLLALAWPALAEEAAGPAEALEQGRTLIRSFDYSGAVVLLEGVVSNEAATAGQRCQALELIGAAELIRRRQVQARQAFERLVTLDPGHEMNDPEIPPRVARFFAQVRERFQPPVTVEVEVRAPEAVPPDGIVTIEARVAGDAEGVEHVIVFVRSGPDQAYREVVTSRAGLEFSAEVDLPEVTTGLDYHVEVRAPSGHVLARVGTAEEPRRVEPGTLPEPEPAPVEIEEDRDQRRPWYRTWWFWTIVGVAVAGGVTTSVVLAVPGEDHQDGTFGSVQMP